MDKSIVNIVAKMESSPANIKFSELEKVCDHYFQSRNSKGTSYRTYKTPWPGNPRVNIQNANGRAKPYQVAQVLQAIDKMTTIKKEEE